MHHRCEGRVFLLSVFLVCQLVVVALYIWGGSPRTLPPARFLKGQPSAFYHEQKATPTFYLPSRPVDEHFVLINDTICFREGTDMRRSNHNGRCECVPEHHGNDCSLPEVIWRAFIASRHETVISRRAGRQRRILLVSDGGGDSGTHQATQLQSLGQVIDLFVLPKVHNLNLLKGLEDKVLVAKSWQSVVKNLDPDDLVLHVPAHVVPLPAALLFFKLFDGFPSPIRFRLKWNVYGYFFQHPNKTRLYPESDAALTIGDLNHYGGWFCELCDEQLNDTMLDAVGEGLYRDQRTPLIRAHSSQPYFAPQFLLNNSWQFDSLLTNVYNKLDYN